MPAEFSERIVTVDTTPIAVLKRVFAEVIEEEVYLFGHGGYTGTFAEKDPEDIEIVTELDGEPKDAWTESEAREHAMNNADKGGPALAYPLDTGDWFIGAWCSS